MPFTASGGSRCGRSRHEAVGAVLQRNVQGVPIKDADGTVWTIAPKERISGWDKVVWVISNGAVSGRV